MSRFPGLARLAFVAVLLVSCKTGSPNTLMGAALTTGAAIGASAANRAAGGCFAMCTNGTVCNPNTGLCDRQASDGRCGPSEICEETFTGSKCVAGTTGVVTKADRNGIVLPVAPIAHAPDANHAAPTIVPAAEQRDAPK